MSPRQRPSRGSPTRGPWRRAGWLSIALIILSLFVLAGRQGALPISAGSLLAVDLAKPHAWLIDWRLSALRNDPAYCRDVLRRPYIEAEAVEARPIKDGCGWTNGFRLRAVGGARLSVEPVSCEMAAAFALWLVHVVQPAAREILGVQVASIQHFGAYSCRNIAGSRALSLMRSQHATANALDITGFTLADGRRVTVLGAWHSTGIEGRFMQAIHEGACRYFRVAVGPEYNAAHRDHFHFDRGFGTLCR